MKLSDECQFMVVILNTFEVVLSRLRKYWLSTSLSAVNTNCLNSLDKKYHIFLHQHGFINGTAHPVSIVLDSLNVTPEKTF